MPKPGGCHSSGISLPASRRRAGREGLADGGELANQEPFLFSAKKKRRHRAALSNRDPGSLYLFGAEFVERVERSKDLLTFTGILVNLFQPIHQRDVLGADLLP
jgi:hypothetical protein